MRIILHLDVDAFFASVEQGYNPRLSGKPVVVGGLPNQRGCVHSASYEARRKCVTVGMPLRRAAELCPEAVFIKGDYRHYRAIGLAIEDILRDFSPDVEIASLDDAYIYLTNVRNYCCAPIAAASTIQRRVLERVNVTVSIGIASSKLIARIASGLNKPAGITHVPNGMERKFLAELPVRLLRGIGRKTEILFHELGITTIGQIATLPKSTVIQLLGNAVGGIIWHYAHGCDSRPVKSKGIAKQISRETSFEEDTDDEKLIHGTLRYLSERIADKLRKEKWTARQVHIRVYYADGRLARKSKTLQERIDDGKKLAKQIHHIYAGLPRRRIRVKLVGITVTDIEYRDRQRTIFDKPECSDDLIRSIDDVRRRFGFTTLAAGSTLILHNYYRMEKHGYILHTPSLSQ